MYIKDLIKKMAPNYNPIIIGRLVTQSRKPSFLETTSKRMVTLTIVYAIWKAEF